MAITTDGGHDFEARGKKKSLQSLYLTISDDYLIRAIDMMQFDAMLM